MFTLNGKILPLWIIAWRVGLVLRDLTAGRVLDADDVLAPLADDGARFAAWHGIVDLLVGNWCRGWRHWRSWLPMIRVVVILW